MSHGSEQPATGHHGMVPYLHFNGGDALFFKRLAPKSPGAIAGAALILLCIAVFERWVSSMRNVLEARWRKRALEITSPKSCCDESTEKTAPNSDEREVIEPASTPASSKTSHPTPKPSRRRRFAPFILANDVPRGAIHALQALLGYLLMLSVMTFQAAYIISILVGLGVGEFLFGSRSISGHDGH